MFPLETAEQNIRRLLFDQSVILPHPEADTSFEVLQNVVQCPECEVKFCSLSCLQQANQKYHKIMCKTMQAGQPFHEINEIWKKMHYPPETTSILLILKIFAMIKTQPELMSMFDEFCDTAVNADLSFCHKMLGDKFQDQINLLQEKIAKVFCNDGDQMLNKFLTPDGFTRLLAIIGTNSQGIGSSSFATWVKNIGEFAMKEKERQEVDETIDHFYSALEETVGQFLNNEGSGLYLLQSKLNHSCQPNSEIRFEKSNSTLQVYALRSISANEEITISYLDECQLDRSRHSRQKYLQENYLFLCECIKCQQEIEQPDLTSEEEMSTDDDDDK